MVFLRNIRLYKSDEIPDHILQEVSEAHNKIAELLHPLVNEYDLNVVLSAFNRFHAALICCLITEEGLKQAAKVESISLLRNIEELSGQEIFPKEK